MHIVNFTNEKVTWADEKRGEVTGNLIIPYLLGFLAGISINMSAIAFELTKFKSVIEPDEVETKIGAGEFILINSSIMDLIYCDVLETWNRSYKGKYPNILNNQMLLISAINGYYKELARNYILDPNFENISMVDVEKQRIENYPKYGQAIVDGWDDLKVRQMTVGTNVFLKSKIKISGIMEEFTLPIYM